MIAANQKQHSVCFSGYRPAKMPYGGNETAHEVKIIKYRLKQVIQETILKQRRHFIVGMAEGFDT